MAYPSHPASGGRAPLLAIVLATLPLTPSCGDGPEAPEAPSTAAPAEAEAPPARVELPVIERAMRGPVDNEALTETLDGWLGTLGNKVRIRDFDGLASAFTEDFTGERLFVGEEEPSVETAELPMGVQRLVPQDPTHAVGKAEFLQAIEDFLSPWQRVSQSSWRITKASFQNPGFEKTVEWGTAEIRIHVVGHPAEGGTLVLDATASAGVRNVNGEWRLSHFRVGDRKVLRHGRPMFSEVSRAVGIAYDGLRFGEPGNDRDGWNGVASADVNGDGVLDIFVPSAQRGFLYIADGDGCYTEESLGRGLSTTDGGTGAVFFDYDRDGDQDLAVGFIGWRKLDDSLAGRPIGLFRNDGSGVFEDVTETSGFAEHRLPAYSLTAFDADGDGWTDLFACGYGRMDDEINDSWIEAANGAQDMLFMNDGGKGFVDRTEHAGMVDRSWSYASAAADYDDDGDLDLFVGNNFGTSRLYRNRGDGVFDEVAEEAGVDVQGNVMGVLWTDMDGDGRLDLYLSSPTSTSGKRILEGVEEEFGSDSAQRMMQMANGNKVFLGRRGERVIPGIGEGAVDTTVTANYFVAGDRGGTRAGWSWSAASPDVDLDGHRDIVCANGFVTGELSGDT